MKSKVDKKEFEAGVKIEHEHKNTYNFIKEYLEKNSKLPPEIEVYEHITDDHVSEHINYYNNEIGLPQMERELKEIDLINASIIVARLIQKVNPKTDKKEWALVSKNDNSKVLKYFGTTKPSKEAVQKEEKRVQYFKHQGSVETMKHTIEINGTKFNGVLSEGDFFFNAMDAETLGTDKIKLNEVKTEPELNEIKSWDKNELDNVLHNCEKEELVFMAEELLAQMFNESDKMEASKKEDIQEKIKLIENEIKNR